MLSSKAYLRRFSSRHRRWLWQGFLLGTAGFAASCLSPTLPLPPPDRPEVGGPDASGMVSLSGAVAPSAVVHADNTRSKVSASSTANASTGAYLVRIKASGGDTLELYYVYHDVASERIIIELPGRQGTGTGADGGADVLPAPSGNFTAVDAGVDEPR